jgi:hypothetical protein
MEDIKKALDISPNLHKELRNEANFKSLYKNNDFKKLLKVSYT